MLMKTCLLCLCFFQALFPLDLKPSIKDELKTLILSFSHKKETEIIFEPVSGGFSDALIIKASSLDQSLIIKKRPGTNKTQQELQVTKIASELGLAPTLRYASDDGAILIMDYIDCKTLGLLKNKNPDCLKAVATSLRTLHKVPDLKFQSDPHTKMHQLKRLLASKNLLSEPMCLIYEYYQKLSKQLDNLKRPRTLIHGDLNPKNLFYFDHKLIMVDWTETTSFDPFYDLSYFSIFQNLAQDDEMFFLESYLEKTPKQDDLYAYNLLKELNLLHFGLEGIMIGLYYKQYENFPLIIDQELKSFDDYLHLLFQDDAVFDAQIFYDFGRGCLLKTSHHSNFK